MEGFRWLTAAASLAMPSPSVGVLYLYSANSIRNGTAKMHNAAQWRSSLRRKPSPVGFQRAVEVSANQFLLVKLHVPLRDMADG